MKTSTHHFGRIGVIVLIAVVLVAWLATGHLKKSPTSPQPAKGSTATEKSAEKSAEKPAAKAGLTFEVRHAVATSEVLSASGQTAPDRILQLAAQVEGQITAVAVRKGALLHAGQVIAQIDPRNAGALQTSAEARLRLTELQYAATAQLKESGHVTEGELASKFSDLQSAKAALTDVKFKISHLAITSPVAGHLEEQDIEVGSYVREGQTIGTLIVTNPLVVRGNFPESAIAHIHLGQAASALVAGQTLQGTVRFVSSLADEKTRTFAVEISVDNSSSHLPAGLSATVNIPAGTTMAYSIPASLLSLSDGGILGIKHVSADRHALFTPITILKTEGENTWVTGLPPQIELITQGQGFIKVGEPVGPTPAQGK